MRTHVALGLLVFTACSQDDQLSRLVPRVELDGPLDFGVFLVDAPKTLELPLKNTGDLAFTLRQAAIAEGESFDPYAIDAALPSAEIAPGASVLIPVTIRSSAEAPAAQATLRIGTSARFEDGAPLVAEVNVRGHAFERALALEPTVVDFGARSVGDVGVREVELRNRLPVAVTIADQGVVVSMGSATFRVDDVPAQLDANQRVTVKAKHTPIAAQADQGVWRVASALAGDRVQELHLAGRAFTDALTCAPTSLDYGVVPVGTRARLSVRCENATDHAITISGSALDPTTSPAYAIVAGAEAVTLTPASSDMTVEVAVQPTAADFAQGAITGTLVITLDGGAEAHIPLLARARAPGIAAVPGALSFGVVPVLSTRTLSLIVLNEGNAPIHVTELRSLSPAFVASLAPTTLDPGATVTVEVRYTPPAAGPSASELVILSDDARLPELRVAVDGSGAIDQSCQWRANPDPVQFGLVTIGAAGSAELFLENVGTTPCVFTDIALTSGVFTLRGGAVAVTVAPGSSHRVELSFVPSDCAPQATELSFRANAPTPDARVAIAGQGAGCSPVLCDPNWTELTSFENPDLSQIGWNNLPAGTTFESFVVDYQNVDLMYRTHWQIACGDQAIDLSGWQASSISTEVDTVPGASYVLRYVFGANPASDSGQFGPKTLEVLWEDVVVDTRHPEQAGRSYQNMAWELGSVTVVATGARTRISFRSQDHSNSGPALDRITLDRL